ncbi:hypothetical protein LUZ60_016612 [Juncus effusus]|nr:hypothetical protein LUZ60_016612 [Juncus effusus]
MADRRGKGKEKIDDEDITFQRMVSKMQEVAGERGGYLHGRGALDSDDLLYLKEQMEAEQDAERLLRPQLADTTPAPVSLPLRVEPKPKSGIRQQDLLRNIVEIKPKKLKVDSQSDQRKKGGVNLYNKGVISTNSLVKSEMGVQDSKEGKLQGKDEMNLQSVKINEGGNNDAISLLGLSYDTSDDDDN